jgi:hypothetical protein
MRAITRIAVTHVLADARLTADADAVATSAVRIARAHRAQPTLLRVLPQLPGDHEPVRGAARPAPGPLVTRLRSAQRRAAFDVVADLLGR